MLTLAGELRVRMTQRWADHALAVPMPGFAWTSTGQRQQRSTPGPLTAAWMAVGRLVGLSASWRDTMQEACLLSEE